MAKHIPDHMLELILPFDWDVAKVWQLGASVESISIKELEFLLVNPFWSREDNSYTDFDLTPLEVIEGHYRSQCHSDRIQNADTHQPLDFIYTGGKLWILDGIHRLVKVYAAGDKNVLIRKHPASVQSFIESRA